MPNPDIIFDNGMIYKDGLRQHANSEVNYLLKSKDYIECKNILILQCVIWQLLG